MTPTEFCYWLQGAIEIGGLETVSNDQAALIHEKLLTVAPHNVFTLTVFLLLHYFPPQLIFDEIRKELQTMFIHDIDPSYEGDQQYFHDLHVGKAGHL